MAGLGLALNSDNAYDSELANRMPDPVLTPAASVPTAPAGPALATAPALGTEGTVAAAPVAPMAAAPLAASATPTPAAPVAAAPAAAARKPLVDFNENPLAAIGLVLSNVAAGMRGQELPTTKLAAIQATRDAQKLHQITTQLDVVERGIKIAQTMPVDQRAAFVQGFAHNFETSLPGTSELLKQAVANPAAGTMLTGMKGYVEAFPKTPPELLMKMLNDKNGKEFLDQSIAGQYGQSATAKLGMWEQWITKAGVNMAALTDPKTGLLNISKEQAGIYNEMVKKANPEAAFSEPELQYIYQNAAQHGITPPSLAGEVAKTAATTPVHLSQAETGAGVKTQIPTLTVGPNAGKPLPQPMPLSNAFGSGSISSSQNQGVDYYKELPLDRRIKVDAILEGRVKLPDSARGNSNRDLATLAADVGRVDPTFNINRYETRQQFLKPGTSTANTVNAVNQAIGHAGTVVEAVDALSNSGFTKWNTVQNMVLENTGDPRVAQLKTATHALSSELTRAFRGGEGAEADVARWEDVLNTARSPEQLRGVAQEAVKLLGSRMDTQVATYQRGMWPNAKIDLLTPQARKVLSTIPGGTDYMQSSNSGTATSPIQQPATATAPAANTPAPPPGAVVIGRTPAGVPVYRDVNGNVGTLQ